MNIRDALSFDDVMLVPQHSEMETRSDADISSEFSPGVVVEVPIISANMPSVTGWEMAVAMSDAGGFSILPRFGSCESIEGQMDEYRRVRERGADTGISIGLKDGFERIKGLSVLGANVFVLDVAHADSEPAFVFIEKLIAEFGSHLNFDFVVGNIATKYAAMDLLQRYGGYIGALKVGIGPGAACITREVTGFGVPQLTAIMDVREAILESGTPWVNLIADGGIKNSGDIVKALAAGADTVMVGRLLAGCTEAPIPGVYMGNASVTMTGHHAPEGIEGRIEETGPVAKVMKTLAWGVRSAISYGGGSNIQDLRENAEWVRCSSQSAIESGTRL